MNPIATAPPCVASGSTLDEVADQLRDTGYVVTDQLLPSELLEGLLARLDELDAAHFDPAGIGRAADAELNRFVRSDEICWLDGARPETASFLAWMDELRLALNARLFLGLFDFECHFARYEVGAFYRTHVDAFQGASNRVLSTVLYLNRGWTAGDGGELVLYAPDRSTELRRVLPELGRMVLFLSETFPHEVLPARRRRSSIAGWFRVNASTADRVDPPR